MPPLRRRHAKRSRASESDDSDAEAEAGAKQRNRKKEVAALLADQTNHTSMEEMHALRSYVRNVFEHGDASGSVGGGARRAQRGRRVVNTLPDMFGVIRDHVGSEGRHSRHARGVAAPISVDDADVVDDPDLTAVLNSNFHAVRWRLLRYGSNDSEAFLLGGLSHWCRSGGDGPQQLTIAAPSADGTSSPIGGDEAMQLAHRRESLVDALRRRRQEEDARAQQDYQQLLCEQKGLLSHRADAVSFEGAAEFGDVRAFLQGVMECLPSGSPQRVLGESVVGALQNCGFEVVQDLLHAFADSRSPVVACDRWFMHLQERLKEDRAASGEASRIRAALALLSESGGEHGVSAKELLFTALYGVIGFRVIWMEQRLAEEGSQSNRRTNPAMADDQVNVFRRLLRVHPFSPYRLLSGKEDDSPDASSVAVTASPSNVAAAFSRLMDLFHLERRRVSSIGASLEAESNANIPLQRQSAKYETFRQSLESLSSKFEAIDLEIKQLMNEGLRAQIELSCRFGDAVHCGVIIDEKLASQPTSFIMESVLWTLPPSVANVHHREIEEALEKFLWGQPHALMSDDLVTAEYVHAIRTQLLTNLSLRRCITRKMTILAALRKLTEVDLKAAVEAESEDGVLLPEV